MAGMTAIVAIPSDDDPVWKYSSEKVPHMTLMVLGDQSGNPRLGHIESYLEHVVSTSVSHFGMSVDHRGTLGPQDADVLFFEDHGVKEMENLRAFLLRDPSIFVAYNSMEQYPEWTPHLTMGYPETPAKVDDREYPGFNWVRFDRIALWVEDYDGPEFRLGNDSGLELAMSDEVKAFLAHNRPEFLESSVVRDAGGQFTSKSGAMDLGDLQWNDRLQTDEEKAKLQELLEKKATELAKNDGSLKKLQAKFKIFQDLIKKNQGDLAKITPQLDAIKAEAQVLHVKYLNKAAAKYGSSPSGSHRAVFTPEGEMVVVPKNKVSYYQHPSLPAPRVNKKNLENFKSTLSRSGHMTFNPSAKLDNSRVRDDVAHSNLVDAFFESADVDDFLEHHGIKGMKWGVRRTDAQLGGGGHTTTKQKLKNTVQKLTGRKKSGSETETKTVHVNEKTGEVHEINKDGSLGKKIDSSSENPFISADAERFVKTHQKEGHEMSDEEIKKAINRAENIKKYNTIFSRDPNAEMRAKVEALSLQKQYQDLQKALTPEKHAAIKKFLRTTGPMGFNAFKALDASTGGELSGQMKSAFGDALKTGGKPKSSETNAPRASKPPKQKKQKKSQNPFSPTGGTRSDDKVYNVTNLGNTPSDFGNPFIPAIER